MLAAFPDASPRARQSIMQALVTRVDLIGPKSRADLSALTGVLTAGMSDSFAGVRAWAYKAAWHWWVWNPPMREAINRAWTDALLREEPEAIVEFGASLLDGIAAHCEWANCQPDRRKKSRSPVSGTRATL